MLKPICSDDYSDSGNFDAVCGSKDSNPDLCPAQSRSRPRVPKVAELLIHGGTRPIHEAVMLMVPEAWRHKPGLSESKRAFCAQSPRSRSRQGSRALVALRSRAVILMHARRVGSMPAPRLQTSSRRR